MRKSYGKFSILVENASSGRQLIQELADEFPITPINPKLSKIVRFDSNIFLFINGKCQIPKKIKGIDNSMFFGELDEFYDELFSFSQDSKNSDIVDTVSQFLSSQFESEKNETKTDEVKILIN